MEGQKPLDHSLSGPAKHRYDFHQEKLYHLPSLFDLSDLHIQLLKEEGIKLGVFCVCLLSTQNHVMLIDDNEVYIIDFFKILKALTIKNDKFFKEIDIFSVLNIPQYISILNIKYYTITI